MITNHLQALIELAIDDQRASYEKIIHLAPYGQIDDLLEGAKSHFVRVNEHCQFLLALLPGADKVIVNMVSAVFHVLKIWVRNLFFLWKKNQKPLSHYSFSLLFLTKYVTFFIAKKVTKKSSSPKNSLLLSCQRIMFVLLARFFVFHIAISFVSHYIMSPDFE